MRKIEVPILGLNKEIIVLWNKKFPVIDHFCHQFNQRLEWFGFQLINEILWIILFSTFKCTPFSST